MVDKFIKDFCSKREKLIDLFSGAIDAYTWASCGTHQDTEKSVYQSACDAAKCREDVWAYVLLNGGALVITDNESGKDHKLTLKGVVRGLKILCVKQPMRYASMVEGNYDYYDADAWLQCSLFGDVIYG